VTNQSEDHLATAAADTAAVTQDAQSEQSACSRHDSQQTDRSDIAALSILDDHDHCLGRITFEDDGTQQRPLSSAQRIGLRNDIVREIARLERWCAGHGWHHGTPALDVIVANRFRISKSLVPAWNGHTGRMEIPASRAARGQAAIMHELVHILLPNANRFLAEALAIYLQAAIGGNPAFPNFGRPLHGVAREVLRKLVPEFPVRESAWLEMIRLAELDLIATPAPLSLRIGAEFYGEDQRGQTCIYPLVGSLAQHLIEAHGLERFHAVYSQTPLVPFEPSAGAADRWLYVYGRSLAELEREWKLMIGGPERSVAGAAMAPVPELT
jgi:hypothetical protein